MRDGIYGGRFLTNHGVSAIYITCELRLSRGERTVHLFRSATMVEVEGRPTARGKNGERRRRRRWRDGCRVGALENSPEDFTSSSLRTIPNSPSSFLFFSFLFSSAEPKGVWNSCSDLTSRHRHLTPPRKPLWSRDLAAASQER